MEMYGLQRRSPLLIATLLKLVVLGMKFWKRLQNKKELQPKRIEPYTLTLCQTASRDFPLPPSINPLQSTVPILSKPLNLVAPVVLVVGVYRAPNLRGSSTPSKLV